MLKKILVSLLITLVLIICYYYYYKNRHTLFKNHNCKKTLTFDLQPSLYNSGNSWSIQFWIYIDDLTYNYLKKKKF